MSKLITKEQFLIKYYYNLEDFEKTNLKWEDLEKIHDDFLEEIAHLEEAGSSIMNVIRKNKNVHSVKFRVKDPEHLIEKIIRKKIKDPDILITVDNYKDIFTDLIGLRALHLFKKQWSDIHEYVTSTWDLKENPVVNFRKGDNEEYLQPYISQKIETNEHKFGYRSVHYIIETKPAKKTYFAEIQVRTIFEEGWSEIDHTIRYPYDQENPIYGQFLMILNRLAGSADEMGTFIMFLKDRLHEQKTEYLKKISEKDSLIEKLEEKIKKSKLNKQDIISITDDLDKLKNTNSVRDFLNSIKLPSSIPNVTAIQNWTQLTNDVDFLNTIKYNNKYIDSINQISKIPTSVNITKLLSEVDKKDTTNKVKNKK